MISCQMILLPSTRIISSLKTKYPVTGNNFTNKSTGFSIQISCEQLQISCLQCRHVDGDLRGLAKAHLPTEESQPRPHHPEMERITAKVHHPLETFCGTQTLTQIGTSSCHWNQQDLSLEPECDLDLLSSPSSLSAIVDQTDISEKKSE